MKKKRSLHIIGHPVGLPLKYISGPHVLDVDTGVKHQFTANLGLYGSGCGSPVFDLDTYEVLGMVRHIYYPGLRWTGNCWVSVTNVGTTGAEAVPCISIQAFADAIESI